MRHMPYKFALFSVLVLLAFVGLGTSRSAPSRLATGHPPPPSMFFSCNSDTKKCVCHGAANCIKLSNSGKCSGEVTNTYDSQGAATGGECNWAIASRAPTRGPTDLRNATHPQRFDCFYSEVSNYCDCTGTDDCKRLTDSKQCTGPLTGSGEYKQCPSI